MAKKCVLSTKQNSLRKDLQQLGINTKGITDAQITAALTSVSTNTNLDVTTLLKIGTAKIMDALNEQRVKTLKEKEKIKESKEMKIADVPVKVGKFSWRSNTPSEHKNTLYIYTDNYQTAQARFGSDVLADIDGLIKLENPKMNVRATAAIVRTDEDGAINENAIGFVTKLNAQNAEGKYIIEEGFFTKKQRVQFNAINNLIADKILEALNSGKYEHINMCEEMGLGAAALPLELAQDLAAIITNKLGLQAIPEENTKIKGKIKYYGVRIVPFKTGSKKKSTGTSKETSEEKKESKTDIEKREAAESLLATRPESQEQSVEGTSRNILSMVFPNIEQRHARVEYLVRKFSDYLTKYLNEYRTYYQNLNIAETEDEDDRAWQYGMLYGLTAKTEDDQRLFALKNISINDKSLAETIFDKIKDDMQTLVEVAAEGDESIKEVVEKVLLNDKTELGEVFMKQARELGWKGDRLNKEATRHTKHLASCFSKMLNEDIFRALQKEAAADLEFNENIRMTFDFKSVQESKADIESTDDSGQVDNRSGLNLVKYKLMNPSQSLSIRMKRMLGRLSKTMTTKEGVTIHSFNDMGYVEHLNPQYAYYVLLNEFADMKDSSDFDDRLIKLQDKYPWAGDLVDQLDADLDLNKEFYRAMRTFMPASIITNEGKIKNLNRKGDVAAFLDNVQRNYESHATLGTHSIYDDSGQINMKNVTRIAQMFKGTHKTKTKEEEIKDSPLGWILGALNERFLNTEDVQEAIRMLREEGDCNLTELLKDMGIDTTYIDVNTLLPNIEDDMLRSILEDEMENDNFTRLDALKVAFPEELRNSLRSVLRGIYDIVAPTYGIKAGMHLTNNYSTAYSRIGRGLTIASDEITMASYAFNGQTRFSYTCANAIDKIVNIISDTSTPEACERGAKFLQENFLKFDFLKDNIWLQELLEDERFRAKFEQTNVLGITSMKSNDDNTIQNVSDSKMLSGLVKAFFTADNEDNTVGWYRNPLFSDTDAMVLIKGRRYTLDECVTNIGKVIEQELKRIIAFRNHKGDTIVENYNDDRGNAGKFMHFPQLNNMIDSILASYQEVCLDEVKKRTFFNTLVTQVINIEEQFQEWSKKIENGDKSTIYRNIHGVYTKEKTEKKTEKKEKEDTSFLFEEDSDNTREEILRKERERDEAIEADLRTFFYNDYFAQTQLIQILGGDLAYYKNFRDFIKRNKQVYAAGERIYDRDENGNKMMNTAVYLEDAEQIANSYEDMNKLLNSSSLLSDWQKSMIKARLAPFTNITVTDGQSFRSMKSFRKILQAMGGKWTDNMEKAYNNILNGQMQFEDFETFWQIIKPFVYTHETRTVNGRTEKITTQYKNSEYMLTAMYSVLNTALNQSPYLKALNEFMDEHDIDVIHFHSAVKVGANSLFDINYKNNTAQKKAESAKKKLLEGSISQEEYNNILKECRPQSTIEYKKLLNKQLKAMGNDAYHITPFEDYMVVQPNDDHLMDADAIFSTQLRNIIPADLAPTLNILVKGKKLNYDQAMKLYNALIMDNLIDSFKVLNNRFHDARNLADYLQAQARNNPQYGDEVAKAITLKEDGTFTIPLNSPNLTNKIEQLILSTFENAIQRQKIKGGSAVLVSSVGVDDNLKVKYKNDDPSQGVEYFPVYLPYYMKDMFDNFHPKDKASLNIEDCNMEESLLKGIALRIPTENKYSAMPIKVVGFLPVQAGSAMMVPIEYITMSGTDFDVDKCFLMFRENKKLMVDKNTTIKGFRKWKKAKGENLSAQDLRDLYTEYDGYSDSEIDRIYDKNEDFADYWDEIGYTYEYDTPRWVELKNKVNPDDISETSRMGDIKSLRLRKGMRNNLLIDIMEGILTSPEGSALSTQAGNYNNVKHGSRMMDILHDANAIKGFTKSEYYDAKKGLWASLNALSTQELEQVYSQYATIEDPNSFTTFMANHRNLMDGNTLIGAFAVNSSSHYKYQFLNLTLEKSFRFNIQPLGASTPIEITSVDDVYSPLDPKTLISTICSEYQAASPDNGKDPCLGALGINLRNVYMVDFLSRIGLDPQSTGVLLRSDALENYGKEAAKKAKNLSHTGFDGNISKIVDLNTKLLLGMTLTADEKEYAVKYYAWINNIKATAKALNDAKAISRTDSRNGALPVNVAEVMQQRLEAEDFMSKAKSSTFPIQGFANFIDIDAKFPFYQDTAQQEEAEKKFRDKMLESPIARQQAFYSLGITSSRGLVEQWLPTMSESTLKAIKLLRYRMQKSLTRKSDISTLKKFMSELTTYLLSTERLFGKNQVENRNYFIHDFPMKFHEYLYRKNDKGEYVHKDIQDLVFIKRITNKSKEGIYMKDVSCKTSPQARRHFNEAFEQMFFNGDKETRDMALDLVKYTYFSNGMTYGHSSVSNFITTAMFEALPNFVESLNYMNGAWADADDKHILRFVDQFLLNHTDLIPSFNTIGWQRHGENLVAPKLASLRSGQDYVGDYLDLIQDRRGNVYKKVPDYNFGVESDIVEYAPIKANKTTKSGKVRDYVPFYSWSNDNIFDNELEDRGSVVSLNKLKEKKSDKKSTKEEKEVEEKETKAPEDVLQTETIENDIITDGMPVEDASVDPSAVIEDDMSDNYVPEDPGISEKDIQMANWLSKTELETYSYINDATNNTMAPITDYTVTTTLTDYDNTNDDVICE